MSTVEGSKNDFENDRLLRKRRGSHPQLKSEEAISAEMLAPLPQSNISRIPSSMLFIDHDEYEESESKPLLQVKFNRSSLFYIS